MSKKYQRALASAIGLSLSCALGSVQAQDEDSHRSSPSRGLLLEEFVVTARKREENLQDTPIAITAFSGTWAHD